MYIERDSRRQTPRDAKTDSADSFEYLNRCLDLLINYISDTSPKIMSEFSPLKLRIQVNKIILSQFSNGNIDHFKIKPDSLCE